MTKARAVPKPGMVLYSYDLNKLPLVNLICCRNNVPIDERGGNEIKHLEIQLGKVQGGKLIEDYYQKFLVSRIEGVNEG
jgi:hypothetical protein